MIKLICKIIIFTTVSCCFFHSQANAQSFFNAANQNNPTTVPGGNYNQVMSPDDFKNTVNTLGQQNLSALSEQAKQMLKPTPQQPGMNQPNSANQAGSQPAGAPTSTSATSSTVYPSSSTTYPSSTTQTTYPSQNQVYTGFGNTNNTGTGTTKNSTSNSGGFNIKY